MAMEQVRRIIVQAAASARAADVFAQETREDQVSFDGNALKSVRSRALGGAGLRVIADGRVGYAASTNPDDVGGLVASAMAAARFGPPTEIALPEGGPAPKVEIFDPSLESLGPERLVEMGQAFVERVRTALPDVVVDVGLRRTVGTVSLANSSGLAAEDHRTGLGMIGILNRSSDDEIFSLYEIKASRRAEIDPLALADRAIERWRMTERVVPAPTGRMRIMFAPREVSAVLLPLLVGINGQTVVRGMSPLADRIGETVASPDLTITDDGLYPWSFGTSAYDGEGVVKRRTPIVEQGVLRNFLLDLDAAARLGRDPTGSAARTFSGVPAPGPTTLVITPGTLSSDEMLKELGDGLYVEQVLGAGQSNLLQGAIQINVHLGFLVRGGEIVGRVKDVMIAGNGYEALRQVVAIGGEAEMVGAAGPAGGGRLFPPVIFDGLTVSAQTAKMGEGKGITF